jgi:imidazolonepropionase-like amidohydrolase
LLLSGIAPFVIHAQQPPPAAAPVTAIRAGRLLDPEAGRILTNQIIVVTGNRITDVGPNVSIPAGAQVIDLSRMTVMPGLVDSHNHLALTYKPEPENNVYYYTYVADSTALRAIEAASNGMQMLAAGFTVVRDLGNNGNYADSALRQAIRAGCRDRRSSTRESSSAEWADSSSRRLRWRKATTSSIPSISTPTRRTRS